MRLAVHHAMLFAMQPGEIPSSSATVHMLIPVTYPLHYADVMLWGSGINDRTYMTPDATHQSPNLARAESMTVACPDGLQIHGVASD